MCRLAASGSCKQSSGCGSSCSPSPPRPPVPLISGARADPITPRAPLALSFKSANLKVRARPVGVRGETRRGGASRWRFRRGVPARAAPTGDWHTEDANSTSGGATPAKRVQSAWRRRSRRHSMQLQHGVVLMPNPSAACLRQRACIIACA